MTATNTDYWTGQTTKLLEILRWCDYQITRGNGWSEADTDRIFGLADQCERSIEAIVGIVGNGKVYLTNETPVFQGLAIVFNQDWFFIKDNRYHILTYELA